MGGDDSRDDALTLAMVCRAFCLARPNHLRSDRAASAEDRAVTYYGWPGWARPWHRRPGARDLAVRGACRESGCDGRGAWHTRGSRPGCRRARGRMPLSRHDGGATCWGRMAPPSLSGRRCTGLGRPGRRGRCGRRGCAGRRRGRPCALVGRSGEAWMSRSVKCPSYAECVTSLGKATNNSAFSLRESQMPSS